MGERGREFLPLLLQTCWVSGEYFWRFTCRGQRQGRSARDGDALVILGAASLNYFVVW